MEQVFRNLINFGIEDDGLVVKIEPICTQQFTVTELKRLISLLQNTLNYYEFHGIDDETINSVNRFHFYEAMNEIRESAKNSPPRKKEPKKGFVYLIQNTKTKNLKIGFSTNPESRLKALNLASDVELALLGQFEGIMNDEKNLHEKYDFIRMNSEWFQYSEDIINEFKTKQK